MTKSPCSSPLTLLAALPGAATLTILALLAGPGGPAVPAAAAPAPWESEARPTRRPAIHPEPPPLPRPEAAASPFLLRGTEVRTWITGPIAHVQVTQRWENPNGVPVDGLYIFPLPEDAAVNDMQLRIGRRLIRGEMKRRAEARALYEQARAAGQVAGLLDQERPNIFAQRVANIMPGEAIEVILALDHAVECEDGGCEYVFPTVVGPRFIPAHQGDPGAIDPPVVAEGSHTGQTFSLTVEMDAGVSVSRIASSSHRVSITRMGPSRARAVLARGEGTRLDRDFRLQWKVGSDAPETGLLAWRDPVERGEPGVFTLILQPPSEPSFDDAAPRELVFVLDCSGSMSGVPITAAKNVVRKALRAVRPYDTFQIIRFSESASGLGPAPLTPTPANLQRALAYLDSLQGSGGTHMLAGIQAALSRPADPERLRIVAFLTDGYIGNEREILGEVRRRIGSARLFSFGIGSSVNRYLLEGLAEEGRGAAAFLGPRETPDEMVDRFIRRIETPVLTDIRIGFEDLDVLDVEPARIPDLFAGQTILVHGRYRGAQTGLIVVEGRRRGRTEVLRQVAVLPERAEDNAALGRLWARARIHRLDRQLHDGPQPDVVEAITRLGLRHRLMTAYTSLVAVDSVVSNTWGSSTQVAVPVEMPQDVSYEGVFGRKSSANQVSRVRGLGSMGAPPEVKMSGAPQSAPAPTPVSPREASEHRSLPVAAADEKETGQGANRPGAGSGGLRDDDGRVDAPRQERAAAFTRLVWTRADGSRLVVEADGEVWLEDGRRRTLVAALTAADLDVVQRHLATAGATAWPAGSAPASGTSLLVETPGGSRVLRAPEAVAAAAGLLRLLEGWAG